MKKASALLFALLFLIACGNDPRAGLPQTGNYGESVSEGGKTYDVASAIALMNDKDESEEVVVNGTIENYCRGEGCWLTLRNIAGDALLVEVDNKSFTLPHKIDGKTAFVKGKMIKENNDGKVEIKVLAKGVSIR